MSKQQKQKRPVLNPAERKLIRLMFTNGVCLRGRLGSRQIAVGEPPLPVSEDLFQSVLRKELLTESELYPEPVYSLSTLGTDVGRQASENHKKSCG